MIRPKTTTTPTPSNSPTPNPSTTPSPTQTPGPTATPTNGPTPTPGNLSCGQTECTDDNSCGGGSDMACVDASNGKKYCTLRTKQATCINNPSQENCCNVPTTYSCGYSPCTDNASCGDGYSCVLASNGQKYCSMNSKISTCTSNPNSQNCCGVDTPTTTPKPTTVAQGPTSTPTPYIPEAGTTLPGIVIGGLGAIIIALGLLLVI